MKILNDKKFYGLILIALVILVTLSLCFSQAYNPSPKDMPIAMVIADKGITIPGKGKVNIGESMAKNIISSMNNSTNSRPVKWTLVKSEDEVKEALNKNKYYAAFIFPEDYSIKQASLQTKSPISSEVKIIINQGKNATAITAVTQITNQITSNINSQIRLQIFNQIKQSGNSLTTEQASLLYEPVTKKIVNVNPSGTIKFGSAPVLLITPLWITSLVFALIVYLSSQKLPKENKKDKAIHLTEQIILGMLYAIVIGFTSTTIASGLGMNIPNYQQATAFLIIVAFTFFMLIESIIEWLNKPGFIIFPIITFIGIPVLQLPAEFATEFSRNFIYPWLPQIISTSGLQQIMFFNGNLFNNYTNVLIIIIIITITIIYMTLFKNDKVKQK